MPNTWHLDFYRSEYEALVLPFISKKKGGEGAAAAVTSTVLERHSSNWHMIQAGTN